MLITSVSVVFAQDQVFIKERETQKIQELRVLYRNQVESYRGAEKLFLVAKTNFGQVDTLAALEEAVLATQKLMLERNNVMITYLELIQALLAETNGVELDLKNQSSSQITSLITTLRLHQDDIILSKDRQAMALLADNFEPIAVEYQASVYKTLSLIRIGRIQEVVDKSAIIYADIKQEHSSGEASSLQESRRQRAYAEIDRSFTTINASIAQLNDSFMERKGKDLNRQFYENILRGLAPVYAEISRLLQFLEELTTL